MTRRALRLVVMMIRPPVMVAVLLFAAVGVAQAGGHGLHPLFTIVPFVVGGWFVHATVLNDLGDEPIDRVNLGNARGRPLVSGDATPSELLALGRVAGVVSFTAAWAVDWRVAGVVAAGLLLNAAYSMRPVRLCDRGGLASFLLPTGYVAVPYMVGVLSMRPVLRGDDLLLMAGLYVGFVGRILLKDFRDVRGDGMFGKRTFLLRHGPLATCQLSGLCWVLGTGLLLLVVPLRSAVMLAVASLLACALHGLRELASSDGFVRQQVVIGAIAVCGRGMGVTLLAHLTMAGQGWAAVAKAMVVATVSLLYMGMYRVTLAQRERVLTIRPY